MCVSADVAYLDRGGKSMAAVFVRLTVQKFLRKHKTSHVEPRAARLVNGPKSEP